MTLLVSEVHATVIFSNDFETGNFNGWTGTLTSESGLLTVSSIQANSGTYSAFFSIPATTTAQAYCYEYLGSNYYQELDIRGYVDWNAGTPNSGDADGVKVLGLGNVSSSPQISVEIYNNAGAYIWAVRVYTNDTWQNYLGTITALQDVWTCMELDYNTTGFSLFINGNLAESQTINCFAMNYAFAGETNNGAAAQTFFLDDICVGTSPIGTLATQNKQANAYCSSYSIIDNTASGYLQYPAVFDGYLWIVQSHGTAKIEKCSLTGGNDVISSALLNNSIYEAFPAFVFEGLIYIPASSVGTGKFGSVTVLNETTLSQVAYWQSSSSACNFVVSAVHDNIHNELLFGLDATPTSILAVPISESTIPSDYQFINITSSNGGETLPCIFDNTVYVSNCYPGGGANGTVNTWLFSSSDLSTWTQLWEKSAYNDETGAYFAHISATANYLVVGLMSGTEGTTTLKIDLGVCRI
jgi:hypothetical protein